MDIRLIWLALGSFAIGVEAFVVPALLPQIAAETGVTLVQAGLLVLVFSVTYAIGSPILAALSGSSDRRTVLVASALVLTAGAALASLSAGLGVLILARIVIAMAAGLYAATAQATAVSMSEPHQRGRAVSIVVGGTTLAVAFGAPLGAWMAQNLGWRGTYVGIAVLGLVAALSILVMIPGGIRGHRLHLRERLAVLRVRGVLPALATMTLYMAGAFTILVYIAPLATDAVGVDSRLVVHGRGRCHGQYCRGATGRSLGRNHDRHSNLRHQRHMARQRIARSTVTRHDRRAFFPRLHVRLGRHRLVVPPGPGQSNSHDRPGPCSVGTRPQWFGTLRRRSAGRRSGRSGDLHRIAAGSGMGGGILSVGRARCPMAGSATHLKLRLSASAP